CASSSTLFPYTTLFRSYFLARSGRETCPVHPRADFREVLASFYSAILPVLAPIILIGGIMSGVFTPTEAGVVAVLYVLVIGLFLDRKSTRLNSSHVKIS